MAKYCGGIKFDNTMKIINGIICDAGVSTVDVSKAVTGCGQLWDGALFTITNVDGVKIVTLHNSEGEEVGTPVKVRGNCGVGLDGRFFKVVNGVVSLVDGFVLTVNVTPSDATIKVTDAESVEVEPVSGQVNVFMLTELGDQYTITVSKDGYVTQTQIISNNGDQTIPIELVEAHGDV